MITKQQISQTRYQLDSLDGLRGLAVLLVFLSHASNRGIYLLPQLNVEGIGKSGVFLFFVLSSFLLTYPFLDLKQITKSLFWNYFLRRVFRIYPLYSFYLGFGLITTFLFSIWNPVKFLTPIPFTLTISQFADQLLLKTGHGVTWSILVEFKFYFLLPLVALIFRLLSKLALRYVMLATILTICLLEYIWPQSKSLQNDTSVWPYIPIFLLGSFAAYIYKYWQFTPSVQTKRNRVIIECLGLLSLLTITIMTPSLISLITDAKIARTQFHKNFWEYGVLWALVLLSCLCGYGYIKRFFELMFLRYLGFISFSLYLFHVVVLDYLDKLSERLILHGWIALALSIGVASITWLLIEKPFAKIKYQHSQS